MNGKIVIEKSSMHVHFQDIGLNGSCVEATTMDNYAVVHSSRKTCQEEMMIKRGNDVHKEFPTFKIKEYITGLLLQIICRVRLTGPHRQIQATEA